MLFILVSCFWCIDNPIKHKISTLNTLFKLYYVLNILSQCMTVRKWFKFESPAYINKLAVRLNLIGQSYEWNINDLVIWSHMTIYRRFIVLYLVCFVLDRWQYDFIHIYKSVQSHTSKHTICISSIHNIPHY